MSTKMKLSAESNFRLLACVLGQGLGRFSPLHRSWSLCFRPRYTMPSNCWHMDLESPHKPAICSEPLLRTDPATPLLNSCLSNDSGLFRPLKQSHSGRQSQGKCKKAAVWGERQTLLPFCAKDDNPPPKKKKKRWALHCHYSSVILLQL